MYLLLGFELLDCDLFSRGTLFIPAEHTCSSTEFVCNNTRCIPILWKCDGDVDCADSSDEADCDATKAVMTPCGVKEFTCRNHDCIHASWKCDGDKDCIDGSDEDGCDVSDTSPIFVAVSLQVFGQYFKPPLLTRVGKLR